MVAAGNPFAPVVVTARCRNYVDVDVGRGVVSVLPVHVLVCLKADVNAGVSAGAATASLAIARLAPALGDAFAFNVPLLQRS